MNTYYQEPYIQIVQGDCREVLAELPAESVQCVVTSPPYWGLRKYAGERGLIWGGNSNCEHEWELQDRETGQQHWNTGGEVIPVAERVTRDGGTVRQGYCSLCGAWRGSYGLEPNPEMYVEHTVEILRLIRRVLRKDGVVFWNIGDSYATSSAGTNGMEPVTWDVDGKPKKKSMTRIGKVAGLKPKDLCLIPFKVVIAAQEDGWWVRSIIIWAKPNPMPESATDRPTKSHEYILMLTKSADYYWDADAVREEQSEGTLLRWGKSEKEYVGRADYISRRGHLGCLPVGGYHISPTAGRNIRSVWEFPTQPSGLEMCLKCKIVYEASAYRRLPSKIEGKGQAGRTGRGGNDPDLGNRNFMPIEQDTEGGDVDTIVKVCHCGASEWLSHFAAFPEKLPEICIKAASKEGDLILDPMGGSGRVGVVAKKLGRKAIIIDTSEDYCRLAKRRIEVIALPMFTHIEQEVHPKVPDWF